MENPQPLLSSNEVEQIKKWLSESGMWDLYGQKFIDNGYDNSIVCSNLDEKDLDLIGIQLPGHRKTILLCSKALHESRNRTLTNSSEVSPASRKRGLSIDDKNARSVHDRVVYTEEFLRRAQAIIKEPSTGPKSYKPTFRILLVRHGLSEANVDKNLYKTMADHAIPLAPLGKIQARKAGEKIVEFFKSREGTEKPGNSFHCRLWSSNYKRARETAELIKETAGEWITDTRESVFLGEQQFGLFEGSDWTNGELDLEHPKEIAYYRKASTFGGRFWAKVPLGESRFDVCMRVCRAFGTFHRDANRHGITNLVIVSHGITIRSFLMMWLHKLPEWFEFEPNPQNCSIRVIEDEEDKDYFDGGPEKPRDLLLSNKSVEIIV